MELDFSTAFEGYDEYETIYQELMETILDYLKLKFEPIFSVSFIDGPTIHDINRDYRHIDRETDVISFAFLDNDPNKEKLLKGDSIVDLGEIYISVPRAIEQAKNYGHSLKRELCFLFVHGILHLLGYDHMTPEEEKVMFSIQDEILKLRGITR